MNGRILRALLVLAVAILLPASSALATPALETSPAGVPITAGVACAGAGDCVATGQLGNDFVLSYELSPAKGWTAAAPTSVNSAPAYCTPTACILPPTTWGGTWHSEAGVTTKAIASPKLPSNAVAADGATDLVGSCTWPDNCTFAAHYTVTGGTTYDTVFLSFVNGAWKADAEPKWPPMPNDGAKYHNVTIEGISCSQPGDCSAAGYFEYFPSYDKGLLLTESNGTWGHDVIINSLPASQAHPTIDAKVACGTAAYCIATGAFGVYVEKPTAKDIYGVWAKKSVPSTLDPVAVNCSITGNCVIAGGSGTTGTILEQADGAWKALQSVSTAGGEFTHVACPFVGDCVAVSDTSIESETAGKWSAVPAITAPSDASPAPDLQITSLACLPGANCLVYGTFQNTADVTADFLVTESSGVWNTDALDSPS